MLFHLRYARPEAENASECELASTKQYTRAHSDVREAAVDIIAKRPSKPYQANRRSKTPKTGCIAEKQKRSDIKLD